MKENFLHYIWQTSQFDLKDLKTDCQQNLQIVKKGFNHHDGGPDFQNAIIRIGDNLWGGNVEIHIKSSDWLAHNHQNDPLYDTTILHVVYENDVVINRQNGSPIPTLSLKHRIAPSLIRRYEEIVNNTHQIPCEALLETVDSMTKTFCIEAMTIDRLKDKSKPIYEKLEQVQSDWQEVLYIEIASSFGMRVNKLPFELLAKQLPIRLLSKYHGNLFRIEALMFGIAGMLHSNFKEDYGQRLYTEFEFLKRKHNLVSIPAETWKFLRLRPANFPTIRIAQFAYLMYKSTHMFSQLKENLEIGFVQQFLKAETSEYWHNHYVFDKVSKYRVKKTGDSLSQNIIINAVVPVFYCYALAINQLELQTQCLDLLQATPKEANRVTKYFQSKGFPVRNAFESQGVLQLHNKFCTFKRCISCGVGHLLLAQKNEKTIY